MYQQFIINLLIMQLTDIHGIKQLK